MKKFLALALSLLMILSLAACGSKDTDAEQNDGPSSGKVHIFLSELAA